MTSWIFGPKTCLPRGAEWPFICLDRAGAGSQPLFRFKSKKTSNFVVLGFPVGNIFVYFSARLYCKFELGGCHWMTCWRWEDDVFTWVAETPAGSEVTLHLNMTQILLWILHQQQHMNILMHTVERPVWGAWRKLLVAVTGHFGDAGLYWGPWPKFQSVNSVYHFSIATYALTKEMSL